MKYTKEELVLIRDLGLRISREDSFYPLFLDQIIETWGYDKKITNNEYTCKEFDLLKNKPLMKLLF